MGHKTNQKFHSLPYNKLYIMLEYKLKRYGIPLIKQEESYTDQSNWIKRVINRLGFVAWGGCGFMGPTPGKIEGVLILRS